MPEESTDGVTTNSDELVQVLIGIIAKHSNLLAKTVRVLPLEPLSQYSVTARTHSSTAHLTMLFQINRRWQFVQPTLQEEAFRRRRRRQQQCVVTASTNAGLSAGGEGAEAVGFEPFAGQICADD